MDRQLDAKVSGKKQGAAVGPSREQERGRREEEERGRRRGRSGARPVVVGEEEGRWLREKKRGGGCHRHRGRRGAVAIVVVGEEEGRWLSSSSGRRRWAARVSAGGIEE
jgi:hypothetical protein